MDYRDLKEILNRDRNCGNRKVESAAQNALNALNKLEKQSNHARAGEFYSINNVEIRGHKGRIEKRNKNSYDIADVISFTHSPTTRGMKNIKLNSNPEKDDKRDCYVVPKVRTAKVKDLGKKQEKMQVKNAQDKAVIRHLVKTNKRK